MLGVAADGEDVVSPLRYRRGIAFVTAVSGDLPPKIRMVGCATSGIWRTTTEPWLKPLYYRCELCFGRSRPLTSAQGDGWLPGSVNEIGVDGRMPTILKEIEHMAECMHGLEAPSCAVCSPKPGDYMGTPGSRSGGGGTISDFFKLLGAPLRNVRCSWGSVRERDGTVILRVWKDLVKSVDGCLAVNVYMGDDKQQSMGLPERLQHIDLIRADAPCYLLFCTAQNPAANNRTITGWDTDYLKRGGRVIDLDGDTFIEVCDPVPVEDFIRRPTSK